MASSGAGLTGKVHRQLALLWKRPGGGDCAPCETAWIQNAATRTFSGTNQSLTRTHRRKTIKGNNLLKVLYIIYERRQNNLNKQLYYDGYYNNYDKKIISFIYFSSVCSSLSRLSKPYRNIPCVSEPLSTPSSGFMNTLEYMGKHQGSPVIWKP